jgi:homoserine kinase type II
MDSAPFQLDILSHYPAEVRPVQVEVVNSTDGFSGARLWKLQTSAGTWCLRRWAPDYPTEDRLAFIHAVLRHVRDDGFSLAPLPLETCTGQTFVHHEGNLWELTTWMPGTADYRQRPSAEKLQAALVALAHFHLAAATFAGHGATSGSGPAPGIVDRHARLGRWMAGELAELASSLDLAVCRVLYGASQEILALVPKAAGPAWAMLDRACGLRVPWQPCIRDVWHAHVLFDGSAVTGLIDFGAMSIDHPATDVARLLGSLVGDDPQGWATGLAAYQSVRPLTEDERYLVEAYDRSTVLLSGVNWIDWIYRQRRAFPDWEIINTRMKEILQRLRHLCSCSSGWKTGE